MRCPETPFIWYIFVMHTILLFHLYYCWNKTCTYTINDEPYVDCHAHMLAHTFLSHYYYKTEKKIIVWWDWLISDLEPKSSSLIHWFTRLVLVWELIINKNVYVWLEQLISNCKCKLFSTYLVKVVSKNHNLLWRKNHGGERKH